MTGLRHDALFYTGDADYLDGVGTFVEEGLSAGEPILLALPTRRLDLVRPVYGDRVSLVDMTEAGHNPGRIIPKVLHAFLSRHPGRPVRMVGEPIWPGRSAVAYPRCVQHEALINLAFADAPAAILCPYDVVGLPAHALTDAARTHPVLVSGGERRASGDYHGAETVVDSFNRPLPEPRTRPVTLRFDVTGLAEVRATVARAAARAGLAPERVDDLKIAVTELATNAITHAAAPATLRVWVEPLALVCDITAASVLTDRLAGRIPPPPTNDRGRGLLLVNYLCDLVEIYTDDRSTTVRLHLDRPARSRVGSPPGALEDGLAAASPG